MSNKTTLEQRCLDYIGCRIPLELQDELAFLYDRGYRARDLITEAIRAAAGKEGYLSREHSITKITTEVTGNGTS